MLLACVGIILGLLLLAYGADRFVSGAASIAENFGVSPMIIGLTIVGLATSMPEVLVGSVAAVNDKSHIAIGNALGSNIANTSLVLGLTILLVPITVASKTIRYEYAMMMVAVVVALLLMLDRFLSLTDGIILCVALLIIGVLILRIASKANDSFSAEIVDEIPGHYATWKAVILFILGLGLLLLGAHLLVDNSIFIAKKFGMSDLIIGLTIIAIGTSLPELAASVMSVYKNEADMAVGNIIGSNIFNLLIVLGVPMMISPTEFDKVVLNRDFLFMSALMLLLGMMLFWHNPPRLNRISGFILFVCFIGYQCTLYITETM